MLNQVVSETAITIDHDTGRVRVDTTSKRYQGQLEKAGFKRIQEDLGGYTSWEGSKEQVARTLFRKGPSETKRAQGRALIHHTRRKKDE